MCTTKRNWGQGMVWMCLIAVFAGCGGTPTVTVPPTDTASPTPTTQSTDTPEPAPPPLLMAHYMPWYQAPPVAGSWGWHWTMEHFNPMQKDENGRPEIASHYMPLTGPYDSRDDALLEYQVLLMKLSGIDGVIVDWYGIENFWDYGLINQSTNKLFEHIEKAGLKFAICYEDQTIMHMANNDHLPEADVYTHAQEVMRYLEDTWFGTEAYLKVSGQPMLLIFGPQYFKSASDWEKIFSVLEVKPAFITLDGHTESAALSSYPWPPMSSSVNGELSHGALESYLERFYKRAGKWEYLVAGAFPGFHDIYEEAGVGSSYGYLDAQQGETFKFTLERALEQQPDVIQLITWNDYGEGTSIEPTEEFEYQYLEMVQETRRDMDAAEFSFTAEDLRLPLQLFNLRETYTGDAEVNARLDEAFAALIAGDVDSAEAIITSYP